MAAHPVGAAAVTVAQIARYAKAIVAAIGLAASVATALGLHAAWVPILVAAATALGVERIPNAPKPQVNVIDHGTAPKP